MSTKNIKVMHLSTVHKVSDTRILKQCNALLQENHDVTLVAQIEKGGNMNYGLKTICMPKPRNRIERLTISMIRMLWLVFKHEQDIYQIHDPELIFIGFILKLKGKIVIYDIHENYYATIINKTWIPRLFRESIKKLYAFIDRNIVSYFDGIICAWPKIYEMYKVCNDNAVLLRNFPDVSCFDIVNNKNKKNKIVYAGVITEVRGIREIVAALEQVPDDLRLSLELCGSFASKMLYDEMAGCSGWKKVNYHGWLNQKEVNRIISNCKAGLIVFYPIPNHLHSQPNKLFEYMASAIPVICSDLPMLRSIVEEVQCGLLVDPYCSTEICNAMISIIKGCNDINNMGLRGRHAVESKYNWENEKKSLLALYSRILKGNDNLAMDEY